jgi:hypothetical protein
LGSHPKIASIPIETKWIWHVEFRLFPEIIYYSHASERKKLIKFFKWLCLPFYYSWPVNYKINQSDTDFRGLYQWLEKETLKNKFHHLDAFNNIKKLSDA